MLDIRDHGGLFGGVNRNKYKRWASGTTTNTTDMKVFATSATGSTTLNSYYVEINGLSFKPSLIFAWNTIIGSYATTYKKDMNLGNKIGSCAINMIGTTNAYIIYDVPNYGLQVTNNSFRIPVATVNTNWNWIAVE